MKTYILLPVLALANLLNAQEVLDTIYANERNNVVMFFPRPIRQGIVGAPNFVFTYNREKEQHFGLLQAGPGKESNLLVVTIDGRVYSYILKYQEQLSRLNHFVARSESIGTGKPGTNIPKPDGKALDSIKQKRQYFERFCAYLLKSKNKRLATKRKRGVKLQLQNLVYNDNVTHLVMEVSNTSKIDFEVDYLKVYSVSGTKKKKASQQKLEMTPVLRYQMPHNINKGISKRFVYVLPKFVLGKGEHLAVELQETRGHRKIILRDR